MKNKLLFVLYSFILGGIIGGIIWSFLKIMNLSINLFWNVIPSKIDFPLYTILLCTIGGLVIGIWKKYTGDYPEELEEVVSKVKKNGKYPYDKVGVMYVSAILPLIFGGSIGPEAGLTGIICGLCSWVGDKFKKLFKDMKDLTSIGMSATLSTIFNSPMFGFIEPIESDGEPLPKRQKIILTFITIFGAIGIMMLLNSIFSGSSGLARFTGLKINNKEWLFLIPLCLFGCIIGLIYNLFNNITEKMASLLKNKTIIKCLIAGIILGVIGTLLPFTMFSGEEQIAEVMSDYKDIGIVVLLLTGLFKLFVTNSCISLGFKGGHFFPCIFSGICFGYVFGLLFHINIVFSICVITTTFMSYLMRKPFAVILLLMICFPYEAIPIMLIAASFGSYIPSLRS